MLDAKPRMLTNLDWINTRDDLRLLRSIKYGVPGTAMTPWGDLTSSLQRIQLVIFIRSLTSEKELRESLTQTLYGTFSSDESKVQKARIEEYAALDNVQNKYDQIKKELQRVSRQVENGEKSPEEAVKLYQSQLATSEDLKKHKALDQTLTQLIDLISKESDLYQSIGSAMIGMNLSEDLYKNYLELVALNQNRISEQKDDVLSFTASDAKKREELIKPIVKFLDEKIDELEKKQVLASGKLPSPEKDADMRELNTVIAKYTKFRAKLLSGLDEVSAYQKQEKQLVDDYQQQKSLKK
jgi:hypothetical protein